MDLGLRSDDRVLVLGSSGWFGREFRALFESLPMQPASLWVPGASDPSAPAGEEITAFDPTVVVNFAFLTRERVETEGEDAFIDVNTALMDRFELLAQRSPVRMAVTVSSGAAVTEPLHPYGRLKAREEQRVLDLVTEHRSVVVIRAYSVSGGYVRRPHAYAFSDLLLQAAAGRIEITASNHVRRRYCSVVDALTVALLSAGQGRSGIFETGGDLIEMGELAERMRTIVNPDATIVRPELDDAVAHDYCSDNRSWLAWSSAAGVKPMTLDHQIRQAASILLAP